MSKIKETDILTVLGTFQDKPTLPELSTRYNETFTPVSKELLRSFLIYHNMINHIKLLRNTINKETILKIIKDFNKQNIKPTIQQILNQYTKSHKYTTLTETDLRNFIIDQELFLTNPKPTYNEDY